MHKTSLTKHDSVKIAFSVLLLNVVIEAVVMMTSFSALSAPRTQLVRTTRSSATVRWEKLDFAVRYSASVSLILNNPLFVTYK